MNTIQIIERPDLKTSEIIKLMKEKFNVWSYYNNEQLDKDFPAPKEATIAFFLDSAEPDEETLGLSVNQVSKQFPDKKGITLRQRLLLELAYVEKHGTHMDIKGITFCSGSRNSLGRVPYVDFYDDEVRVYWYGLDNSDARYGIRSQQFPFTLISCSLELTNEQCITQLKSHGYKITREETTIIEY